MDNGTENLVEQLNDEFTRAVLPVTIIVGMEVVFGFFGNLLVIYVFLFHYRVCTFRYFVLCLGFIDITCCLTTMSGEVVTQLHWYDYSVRELCKTKSFFNVFTVTAEALCLVTIAFDRYRKVCRPFGWQLKPRVAIYLCVIYYIISLLVALPTPFFWGLHSETKIYKNTSITVTLCEKDEEFKQTDYPMVYISSVGAVISVLLLLMIVQYVFVAMKLLKQRQQRIKSRKLSKNTAPSSACTTSNSTATSSVGLTENMRSYDSDISVIDDRTDELVTSAVAVSDTRSEKRETIHIDKPKRKKTRGKRAIKKEVANRVRRNTLIMFILTMTFVITTVLYFVLITFIASSKNILQYLTDGQKAAYFFFLRLYFINHIINPAVYGLLDPQFKSALRKIRKKHM